MPVACYTAPDILGIEVLSALRRLERVDVVSPARVAEAKDDFRMLPIRLWSVNEWLDDIWSLRHNVGVYDACYVVLARMLDCPMVTTDARLARAPGLGIKVEVVAGEG